MALSAVRSELRAAAEPERVPVLERFFETGPGGYGEGDVLIGVRVPAARAIARRHADLGFADIRERLASPVHEERLVALVILVRRFERGDADERAAVVELYRASFGRVNNWDLVDVSAPQILGAWLLDRPREELDRLARSASVRERRIAIMATFAFIRAGDPFETLRLAERLLDDPHDLIHKVAGWMLREVGKRDEPLLVDYLERHAARMPRTMLRYAVERLDTAARGRLMALS